MILRRQHLGHVPRPVLDTVAQLHAIARAISPRHPSVKHAHSKDAAGVLERRPKKDTHLGHIPRPVLDILLLERRADDGQLLLDHRALIRHGLLRPDVADQVPQAHVGRHLGGVWVHSEMRLVLTYLPHPQGSLSG